jgi:hypothetical protein
MTKKTKPKKSANKVKHSKLMNQKISKIKLKKINKRERLKEIIKKVRKMTIKILHKADPNNNPYVLDDSLLVDFNVLWLDAE